MAGVRRPEAPREGPRAGPPPAHGRPRHAAGRVRLLLLAGLRHHGVLPGAAPNVGRVPKPQSLVRDATSAATLLPVSLYSTQESLTGRLQQPNQSALLVSCIPRISARELVVASLPLRLSFSPSTLAHLL